MRGARVRRIWNDAVERASERASERGGAEWPVEESSLFAADTSEIFFANPAFASASVGLCRCARRDLASSSLSSRERFLLTGEGRK